MSQRASSYPSGNRSLHSPPVDPCHVQFENPANFCFNNPRPSALDTSNNTHDSANMEGHIESPRPSNKERQARNRQTSLFNVAGLASSDYHGGPWGNQTLEIPFIHSCGYQSISTAAAKDVLLCYQDIQLVHRKVRQGWTNPRTHVSGPSVERILEKGLSVFPKLSTLTAKDTVHFYNKLEELLVGYLLPLMPFDVI
jgi:hypothetical protein